MSDEHKMDFGIAVLQFKRLMNYIPDRRIFKISCFMVFIGTLMLLAGPPLLAYVVYLMENNIEHIPIDKVVGTSVILIAIYVASSVINMIFYRRIAKLTSDATYSIRSDVDEKTNRISVESVKTMNKGEIVSLTMNDCDLIGSYLGDVVLILITALTMLIGTTILMFMMNWKLAIVTLVVSLITIFIIYNIVKMRRNYFVAQQMNLGKLTSFVNESYEAKRIIELYGGKNESKKIFSEINKDLKKNIHHTTIMSNTTTPMMSFAMYMSTATIMICASHLIIKGEIDLAMLVAFLVFVKMFFTPLMDLANMIVVAETMIAGMTRVFNYLDKEEMPHEDDHGNIVTKGHVEFRHISFGYSGEDIIHDFSIDIKPGQKVAIVGKTGAGKTTIVNLLMRFYEIKSGEIIIDGISTKEMSRKEVHDLFCMVLQDTWIFSGTIRENIIFCHKDINDDDVRRVSNITGINNYIEQLPDGFDTVIDSHNSLSEGQRQQLTLARAMLDKAPMLILDEATSSIDTKMEQQIQTAVDELTKGRTSFIIAHRLATIKNADVIIVMNRGKIVEVGKHDELMAQNGTYSELYNSQFVIPDALTPHRERF